MLEKNDVLEYIQMVEDGDVFLPRAILEMDGMSTHKIRRLFNLIGGFFSQHDNYLEVGCWKCATFCSALYGNLINGYAIDNFSQFTNETINGVVSQLKHPKDIALKNLEELSRWNISSNQFGIIEADAFKIDLTNIPKIQLYFYDGEHSEESHYQAFTKVDPILDDNFVTIIDDWCDGKKEAAKGTLKAFKDLNYNVDFKVELPNTGTDKNGWWNGLMIAGITKNK